MDFGLTPEAVNGLLVLAYLGGVSLRVAWPFLLAYFQTGASFDWHYVIGQFVLSVVGLLGVIASSSFLGDLGAVGYAGAIVAGYGAASIGRESQKTAAQIKG